MTFSTTINHIENFGSVRSNIGVFTQESGDVGGALKTGLGEVRSVHVTVDMASGESKTVGVDQGVSFPVRPGSTSGVVIVTSSGVSGGVWTAYGTI